MIGNLRQSSLTYQNGPVCSAAFDFIYYSNYLKFMCYATSRSGACSVLLLINYTFKIFVFKTLDFFF